jgi:peptide/nickel transport system substrate-binding protein
MKRAIFVLLIALLSTMMLPYYSKAQEVTELPRDETLILGDVERRITTEHLLQGGGLTRVCSAENWLFYTALDGAPAGVVYYLAESYDFEEPYTHMTIHLRPDAVWSDGKPFTAEDVVFSFEILFRDEFIAPSDLMAIIEDYETDVYASDEHTVEIDFVGPTPRGFPILARQARVFAPQIYEDMIDDLPPTGDETTIERYVTAEEFVTLGPYIGIYCSPETQTMVYERIEDWWGNKYLEEWTVGYNTWGFCGPKYVVKRFGMTGAMYTQIAAGEIDYSAELRTESDILAILSANPDARQITTGIVDSCSKVWWFAATPESYPLNIAEVRHAVSLAVDRSQVTTYAPTCPTPFERFPFDAAIRDAGGEDSWHMAYMELVDEPLMEEYKPLEYNLEKAEQILLDLGFSRDTSGYWLTPEGKPWEISLMYMVNIATGKEQAQFMMDQLDSFGIHATVHTTPSWSAWDSVVTNGGVPGPDPDNPSKPYDLSYGFHYFEMVDPWAMFNGFTLEILPVGEMMPFSSNMLARIEMSDEFIQTTEELSAYPYDMTDPNIRDMYYDLTDEWYSQWLGIGTSTWTYFAVYDASYFTGFPNPDLPYMIECGYPDVFSLKPVEWVPEMTYVWFTAAVEAFTGADNNEYGPFAEGAFAQIPQEDANRLVQEGSVSFTPPIAGLEQITETLSALSSDITGVETSITELSDSIEELAAAGSGMNNMLIIGLVVEAIAIVVLVIVIAMRK